MRMSRHNLNPSTDYKSNNFSMFNEEFIFLAYIRIVVVDFSYIVFESRPTFIPTFRMYRKIVMHFKKLDYWLFL